MTTSQKAALSLLISVLLFGAFAALAYTGLFNLIEARFYNPSITSSVAHEITRNGDAIDSYFTELQTSFSGTLKDSAVRHSFLPNQNAEDILERSRIYGLLSESVGGLQWVRFIDSGGARIHFSTNGADILQQDRQSVSYRNYSDQDLPYEKIAVADGGVPKYTFDGAGDRILFSFPFYDSFEVYRGTAVFALSVRAISDRLINEGRIKVGQDISVISDPPGLLSGTITTTEKALASQVAAIWEEGGLKVARLTSPDSDTTLALISVKTTQGFFIGRLVSEDQFSFPQTMKIILLASFFITVYLIVFLLFNLRQDSVTIVQNRLKQLQISLIEQYYERKGDMDWSRWSRELEQRRDEISAQLKQGIKTASGGKKGDIDVLIDKSWDELLSVIGGRKDTAADEEKLQTILNRVLAALPGNTAPVQISPQPAPIPPPAAESHAAETPQEAEEAEELEEVEEVEELTEEAELVEDVDEVPAALEAEEPAPVEEIPIAAKAEEEPIEELQEAEELEELQEIDEAEGVEVQEEILAEPAPEFEADVPVIDAAEMNLSADLVNEAVDAFETVEEVEELEELDEAEEVEELEDGNAPAELSPEASGEYPGDSKMTIEKVASQIEFSPILEQENSAEETLQDDLEIVSPFSTILFDFENLDDYDAPPSDVEEVEEVVENIEPGDVEEKTEAPSGSEGVVEYLSPADSPNDSKDTVLEEEVNTNQSSLLSKPFLAVTGDTSIETLEVLPEENDKNEDANNDGVIEEREGIHYISSEVLSSETDTAVPLDRDFKKLVDSIIK